VIYPNKLLGVKGDRTVGRRIAMLRGARKFPNVGHVAEWGTYVVGRILLVRETGKCLVVIEPPGRNSNGLPESGGKQRPPHIVGQIVSQKKKSPLL